MIKKYNTIIGIDPDVDKSGYAVLDRQTKRLSVYSLTFPELIDTLREMLDKENTIVIVEAGWLNQSNWHLTSKDTARGGAAKGRDAGRNHEVGRKIAECAEHYGCNVELMKPLRKSWRGKDGKITHAEISQFAPVPSRTNQEERDAVLLAWHYACFPMRVKY